MLPSHFNGIYAARLPFAVCTSLSFDLAFVPFLAALVPAVEHTVLILAISPHHIFSLAFLSSP
jgi:hypothetical protein